MVTSLSGGHSSTSGPTSGTSAALHICPGETRIRRSSFTWENTEPSYDLILCCYRVLFLPTLSVDTVSQRAAAWWPSLETTQVGPVHPVLAGFPPTSSRDVRAWLKQSPWCSLPPASLAGMRLQPGDIAVSSPEASLVDSTIHSLRHVCVFSGQSGYQRHRVHVASATPSCYRRSRLL